MIEKSLVNTIKLHQNAANCNSCFKKFSNISHDVVVKGAQPRSIGKNYFSQKIRVCLVLINPGAAHTQSDEGWDEYLTPLKKSKNKEEREIAWKNIQDFIEREDPEGMHRIILWFRNDLRIHDNYILKTAYNTVRRAPEKTEIVPVFCFDPRFYDQKTKYGTKKCGFNRTRF